MIEFKTETEDKIEDETYLSSGGRVTIIHEAACDTEIKIENEVIRHYDYKENIDNTSISHWKRCTESNVLDPNYFETHPCSFCNIKFKYKEEFLKHLRISHRTFRCEVDECGDEFENYGKLAYHKKIRHAPSDENNKQAFVTSVKLQDHYTSHIGVKPFNCTLCNINFKYKKELLKHLRNVHRIFRCEVDECGEELENYKRLCYHRRSRHNPPDENKIYECQFENCNFKHKTSVGLQYHNLRHHSEKSHICSFCSKAFFLSGNLKRHLLTHTGEKPFACNKCPKAYVSPARLRDHYYSHIGVRPYNCRFCEKDFTNANTRRIHERLHTKEKPYVCKVCQKTFASNTGLYCHSVTHSGIRRFTCEVCQESFKQGHHLKQHEKIHTGEKPFCCDVCDHRFALIGHLRTHLKTHTRGKPFSCSTCQSTFSFKSQLTAHERIHSGDAVFICALCDKTYFEKRSLRVHLQKCYNQRTYRSTSDIQEGNVVLRITRKENSQ